jgi:hypothetical protein
MRQDDEKTAYPAVDRSEKMPDWFVTVLSGETPVDNIQRFPNEIEARRWVADNIDSLKQGGMTGTIIWPDDDISPNTELNGPDTVGFGR